MALRKLSFKTAPEDARKRLDQFLTEKLPEALGQPVSKGKARKLVVAGAVYLNGRRVRIASKELIPGARVELFVDSEKLASDGRSRDRAFEMTPARVLYEDEWLIVVDKPAGLPTQPTLDEARENLFAAVKKFLARRDGQADPYVGLHHRLDRDTSGVVLFTKAREANAGVAALFAEHGARKVYRALTRLPGSGSASGFASGHGAPVEGQFANEWTVKNYLGKASGPGKKARISSVRSGGDFAHTDFKVLERLSGGLHIEARPLTGRTHQIRVHLAEGGLPILGDDFYGAPRDSASRVMLHAVSLTFTHPVNKTELSIQSPLPEDFLQCLNQLRRREDPDSCQRS
ncbi:MAG: RluA family pseudouridine synthase [Oligoflexia bacterium]|nr:RluA family pseudouridine synthase [Oligoflexia bacterium]